MHTSTMTEESTVMTVLAVLGFEAWFLNSSSLKAWISSCSSWNLLAWGSWLITGRLQMLRAWIDRDKSSKYDVEQAGEK